MPSRWMAPKLAKMQRDRLKAAEGEGSRRAGHTIATSNALMDAVTPAVTAYQGAVTVAPKGRALKPIGKQRRTFEGSTYGNGVRFEFKVGGLVQMSKRTAADYYDLWSCEDRLIKAGQV